MSGAQITDLTQFKALLNAASTLVNSSERLQTLQSLNNASSEILEQFPPKALRLFRAWLIESFKESTTMRDSLVKSLLQLLERVSIRSAESIAESKILPVITKITREDTKLPQAIIILAKRVAERLSNVNDTITSASPKSPVDSTPVTTSLRKEQSKPVNASKRATVNVSSANKTSKAGPSSATTPTAHTFDIFSAANSAQNATSSGVATSSRRASNALQTGNMVSSANNLPSKRKKISPSGSETDLGGISRRDSPIHSPAAPSSGASSPRPNPITNENAENLDMGGDDDDDFTLIKAAQESVAKENEAMNEAERPAKRRRRVTFAPASQLLRYREIPARELNDIQHRMLSMREYERGEGMYAKQRGGSSNSSNSNRGFHFQGEEDNDEIIDNKNIGSAPATIATGPLPQKSQISSIHGNKSAAARESGKITTNSWQEKSIETYKLDDPSSVTALIAYISGQTGVTNAALRMLTGGKFYQKPIAMAAMTDDTKAKSTAEPEIKDVTVFLHPSLHKWRKDYMGCDLGDKLKGKTAVNHTQMLRAVAQIDRRVAGDFQRLIYKSHRRWRQSAQIPAR